MISDALNSYRAFFELHEVEEPLGEFQDSIAVKIHPKDLVPKN